MDIIYYLAIGVEGLIITVGFLIAAIVAFGVIVFISAIVRFISRKLAK